MSYIAATDFICCTDGYGTAWAGFWPEVSLFLYYYYYSVAYCGAVGLVWILGFGRELDEERWDERVRRRLYR